MKFFAWILSLLFISVLVAPLAQSEDLGKGPPILILYDGPQEDGNSSYVESLYLGNLLGHFTTNRTLVSLENYVPGLAGQYAAVFCIIEDSESLIPEAIKIDLSKLERPLCFMTDESDPLLKSGILNGRHIALDSSSPTEIFSTIIYKGKKLQRSAEESLPFTITGPGPAVLAEMQDEENGFKKPFVINEGFLWLFADIPLISSERGSVLVLADLLHDILSIPHPESRQAFLRLEDLNPATPPSDIKRMIKIIEKYHIPFSFGFTPVFVDPRHSTFVTFNDRPDTLKAVKQLMVLGGRPVLHGFTHQIRGVTGNDYEFWDSDFGEPLDDDTEIFAENRVEKALGAARGAGLEPVAWETPHYAGTQNTYKAVKKYFASVYERRLLINDEESEVLFPFSVTDLSGQFIIPENLGYFPRGIKNAENLLGNVEAASVVRDGAASFFFHPFMPSDLLEEAIRGIIKQGYQFSDINQFPHEVKKTKERASPAELKSEERPGSYVLWIATPSTEMTNDERSFHSILNLIDLAPQRLSLEEFLSKKKVDVPLIIIPEGAAKNIDKKSSAKIYQFAKDGGVVIFDGDSPLRERFKLHLSTAMTIYKVIDELDPSLDIRWPDKPQGLGLENLPSNTVVYYRDAATKNPLSISQSVGKGSLLYFSVLFDPLSTGGFSRFPDFAQIIVDKLKLKPVFKRQATEAYFDPGLRENIDMDNLIKSWRNSGIRVVYTAAWTYENAAQIDFARFIEKAHQNGILVYAWFEWPHVGWDFWKEHPQWREKTATLRDGHVDWRYLMNFQNPECRAAVLKDSLNLLQKYPWDGVNIAEIYFEPPNGPNSPDSFTPMNDDVRVGFKKLEGFDPHDLFVPSSPHFWSKDQKGLRAFYQYRRKLTADILDYFLNEIHSANLKNNWKKDFLVTVIDVYSNLRYRDYLGIDEEKNLELAKKYGANLQIEDPYDEWSKPPDRYERLRQNYAEKISEPYSIDINIVPTHHEQQIEFPTSQPAGTELFQLYRAASSRKTNVCFYAESTVRDSDWPLIPYVSASEARIYSSPSNESVVTPYTVQMSKKDPQDLAVNGQTWPCQDSEKIILGPGESILSSAIPPDHFDFPRLTEISCELHSCQPEGSATLIEYDSPSRCALQWNEKNLEIEIDGENQTPLYFGETNAGTSFILPSGSHKIMVRPKAR